MRQMKHHVPQLTAALLAAFLSTPGAAQTGGGDLGIETKIVATDLAANRAAGRALDANGDRVIVGAPEDDEAALNAGAAYIYRRENGLWVEEQKLLGLDQEAVDELGTSVAIQRDLAVVGAPFDNSAGSNAGAVYVYRRVGTTWMLDEKLVSGEPDVDWLGFSVDLEIAVPRDSPSGEEVITIAAGAPQSDLRQGAVILFELSPDGTTWNEIGRLVDDVPASRGELGTSVAFSGDRIVAGAPKDDVTDTDAGGAYIFRRQGVINTWSQEAALLAGDGAMDDEFGTSVAIDGDWVLVGAPFDDDDGQSSGSAYLYRGIGSSPPEQKITASDATAGDEFGHAVALETRRALIGAPGESDNGFDAGAIYLFEIGPNNTWMQSRARRASDARADERFGASVAIGTAAFAGADRGDVQMLAEAGAVYAFEMILFADGFEAGTTAAWSVVVP